MKILQLQLAQRTQTRTSCLRLSCSSHQHMLCLQHQMEVSASRHL
nr:MAG TPA: hypothetical protein [Caudoviricetes sp.]